MITRLHGRRFSIVAAAAGIAATLVLTGCAGSGNTASSNPSPVAGGTLVYASGDAEPTCLDPHVGGNYPQALISTQYLETLVGRDSKGKILPWLAKSWETSKDGKTVTFNLRTDVKFSDGTPFNAAAVKANIEHVQDPNTASSTGYLAVSKVKSVEAKDAHTAVFHLSAPDSALLESLSQIWVAMEAPSGLKRGVDKNCKAPIGTGPFTVASWTPQQNVTLLRNKSYTTTDPAATHKGPAYLDKVVWRFIPDVSTRYSALQSGEVQMIDNPQPDTVVAAKKSSKLTVLDPSRPGSVNRIELNSGKAPFNDKQVREAFIKAAVIDPGIKSLFFGTVKRSTSPLSSVEPFAYSDPALFRTNPAEAAKLLDAAGWKKGSDGVRIKDGKRLTVTFPVSTNQSIPAEQSLFEQMQAAVAKVGFEVKLKPMDLSSWYAALAKDDYNAVSAPYTKVGPDVLRILYHSDSLKPAPSGYFANHTQVNDPKLDAILSNASQESNEATRKALYDQAQKIILSGYYILPLYDQQNEFLISKQVSGVRALQTVSTPTLLDASISK